MIAFLIIIHVICCLGLITIVLLQAGKGAGLASTFGASAVESALGAGASDFLKKVTTVMAVAFMLTSLSLAFLTARRSASVVKEVKPASQQTEPITGPGRVTLEGEDAGEDKVLKGLEGKSKKELQKVLKEITEQLPIGDKTDKTDQDKTPQTSSEVVEETQPLESKPEVQPSDVSSTGQ